MSQVTPEDMKRAFHLLAGPGFGQKGMSIKKAVLYLFSEGMEAQRAYFAVQAGAQLARAKKIPVRKQATPLRGRLIRLAHANPGTFQKMILPLLEE